MPSLHLGSELGVAAQLWKQRVLKEDLVGLELMECLLVAVQGPVVSDSRS